MSGKGIIETNKAPKPIGAYSQAVNVGNLLFVSGQLAVDPETGRLNQGSLAEQVEIIMQNIESILKVGGSGLGNIVQASIYLTDISKFSKVNEAYAHFFKGDYPARVTVEVSSLPGGAEVEIAVIAFIP
jgi:2-iminobutanoate/2-iminopropanoate deaminase